MGSNPDFTYVGTFCTAIPEQADAKWYAVQIERRYPKEAWKDKLVDVPEDKREGAAAYLRDRYRLLVRRERLNKPDGKKSPVADRELERMRVLVGAEK